jgi:hypothetical protein
MQDYDKKPLAVGDSIKNIESGWHGRIMSTEGEGADLMLVCLGINFWTGELDEDDKQWHSPFDVKKVSPIPGASPGLDGINLM